MFNRRTCSIAAVCFALIAAGVLVQGCTHDPKRFVERCGTFTGCMACVWNVVLCSYPDPAWDDYWAGEGEGE
jgi:hypothetical protein